MSSKVLKRYCVPLGAPAPAPAADAPAPAPATAEGTIEIITSIGDKV